MNKLALTIAALIIGCTSTIARAQRVDNRAVQAAASDFRQAVVQFEKLVVKVRGISRRDELVVDKFEESTRRVVLYAKNPRQTSKLTTEYRKMLDLQAKAEVAIFQKYTAHFGLTELWNVVLWYQQIFEQELAIHMENPRNANRVQRRDMRDLTFRSSVTPVTALAPPASLLSPSGTLRQLPSAAPSSIR